MNAFTEWRENCRNRLRKHLIKFYVTRTLRFAFMLINNKEHRQTAILCEAKAQIVAENKSQMANGVLAFAERIDRFGEAQINFNFGGPIPGAAGCYVTGPLFSQSPFLLVHTQAASYSTEMCEKKNPQSDTELHYQECDTFIAFFVRIRKHVILDQVRCFEMGWGLFDRVAALPGRMQAMTRRRDILGRDKRMRSGKIETKTDNKLPLHKFNSFSYLLRLVVKFMACVAFVCIMLVSCCCVLSYTLPEYLHDRRQCLYSSRWGGFSFARSPSSGGVMVGVGWRFFLLSRYLGETRTTIEI